MSTSTAATQQSTVHASLSDYLNDRNFFQQVLDQLIAPDSALNEDHTEFSFASSAAMSKAK